MHFQCAGTCTVETPGSHSHPEVAVNWEKETFPLLQCHQSPNVEGVVDEFPVVSIPCYGHRLHNERSDYSFQHSIVGQVLLV